MDKLDFVIYRTASDEKLSLDSVITNDNYDDVVEYLNELISDIPDENELEYNIDVLKEDIYKSDIDNDTKLLLISKLSDIIDFLSSGNKKACLFIAYEKWENLPSGRQRTKNPEYKGPGSNTQKYIYRDKPEGTDVKSLNKPKPSWFEENKFSNDNKENLINNGFTNVDKKLKISDDTVFISLKSGKYYKFGDLPKSSKDKLLKRIEDGEMMKSPSSIIKKEPVKKEPVKKETVKKEPVKKEPVKKETVKKETVKKEPVKKEPVKKETVKKEQKKVFNKKKLDDAFKNNDKKSLLRDIGKSIGKGVGSIKKFKFNVNKVMNNISNRSKKKWIDTKSNVKHALKDVILNILQGYLEGEKEMFSSSINKIASLFSFAEKLSDEQKIEVVESVMQKMDERKAVDELVIACIKEASRGMQLNRKDKDLISDTGGSSYKRDESSDKPSRMDLRKPFSKKNKKPSDYDKDIDLDSDLRLSFVVNNIINNIIKNGNKNE